MIVVERVLEEKRLLSPSCAKTRPMELRGLTVVELEHTAEVLRCGRFCADIGVGSVAARR
jgi:hypothetical protein